MATFQGLLFLFFGACLLWMDYRALRSGWLPCGPRGFKGRLEFRRDERPMGFWVMFVVYGTAGLCLVTFALNLLAGHVAPLPLR